MVQIQQGRYNETCGPMKETADKGELENSKLRKHKQSTRKNSGTTSQRPTSATNLHSTTLRTKYRIELWILRWRVSCFCPEMASNLWNVLAMKKKSQCVRNKNTILWKLLEELLKKRENELGCVGLFRYFDCLSRYIYIWAKGVTEKISTFSDTLWFAIISGMFWWNFTTIRQIYIPYIFAKTQMGDFGL